MTDINREIERLDWHREPYGLYEPIEYTLSTGGKRLRPQLAILGSSLFGGKEEDALPAALALEVFHNFTLLHDDVMDKAPVRRGRPTVHVRWNNNTAILSGDQMMIEAYKQLSRIKDDKLPYVLRLFNDMATGICEGQQLDMEFEQREDVSISEYINMIRLKTSLLLGYALQIGAYIAGAGETEQKTAYEFGENLGLAFQIQDDLLDVYGDPDTFGKAIGGDILCGKKTFMLLSALKMADSNTGSRLLTLLRSDITGEERINSVKEIYDYLNVKKAAEDAISGYTHKAKTLLSHLPQNAANTTLRQLADHLTARQS